MPLMSFVLNISSVGCVQWCTTQCTEGDALFLLVMGGLYQAVGGYVVCIVLQIIYCCSGHSRTYLICKSINYRSCQTEYIFYVEIFYKIVREGRQFV